MSIATVMKRFSWKMGLVLAILAVFPLIFFLTHPRNALPPPPETAELPIAMPAPTFVLPDSAGVPAPVHRLEVPSAIKGPPPLPTTIREISGRVDSWQDWNSSFSDTVTRTYSAIFDSARIDTLSGGRLAFSPTGRSQDFWPVSRVFCRIDSVRELIRYTFPGEEVRFSLGVAFAPSLSFRASLQPRVKSVGLDYSPHEEEPGMLRNQFLVVLNSPTGYAYSIRTGIESAGGPGGSFVYYTPPVLVEFRRMIRYKSLLAAAADTVYLLTRNPRAVTDVARALPRAVINTVFVPRSDPDEADPLTREPLANVRLHLTAPRNLDQSFLIINDSEAILEENLLDPDFRHVAQLRPVSAPLDQTGLPRITHLILARGAVTRLKGTFQQVVRTAE
jgi:hypothetical protein